MSRDREAVILASSLTLTAVSALTLRRARFRSQATFVGVSREMWPGIGRERSRHGRERAEQSAEQQLSVENRRLSNC